jgi:hypothetical protein
MDPARGMGVTTRELKTALERLGFDVGRGWYEVRSDGADEELAGLFESLHEDLRNRVPSIVCTRFDESPHTTEHFRLVLGYDAERDEVVYHEPAEDDGAYRRMSRTQFLSLWPLKYRSDRWTVIRLRLDGKQVSLPERSTGFHPADFAQHVMKVRKRMPKGTSLVVEPPFVVMGDGGGNEVSRRATGTVRWAVQKLGQDFFTRPPRHILDVYLFENAESYERNTRSLLGESPSTPYGFYSRKHRALVMNIATGGGTLVHEIVHPYMEANFPACPAWFNEGLGSLFEQSADRDGHIVGLTNWRLKGLQRAIRKHRVPKIRQLLSTSEDEFYADDSGIHYAMARYLLYYLQERGLLREYYRAFSSGADADQTGYATLVRLLHRPDMEAFQKQWEAYVLALSFP